MRARQVKEAVEATRTSIPVGASKVRPQGWASPALRDFDFAVGSRTWFEKNNATQVS